jgi:endonuclease/exonuclease/phosphatase family metal-dependent hydrolase
MKLTKIFAMAAMAMGLFACKPAEKVSLTIVQYNVGAFSKYEGSGIDAIVTAVKEMGADAVTFNEVDSCTTRTGVVDQLASYAQGMGEWNQYYAAAMPYKGGAYGVGVAAKPELEVVRTDKIALPQLDGREPRAVAVVEYKDFVLCSTHLDLTLESQLGQVKTINEYMDSHYADCGKPVFIGGDFNCFPDSEPIALMKETWTLLTPVTNSFPSHAPDRCIDFIFARPNGKKINVEYTEIPETLQTANLATASDHLPVVLKVTIE